MSCVVIFGRQLFWSDLFCHFDYCVAKRLGDIHFWSSLSIQLSMSLVGAIHLCSVLAWAPNVFNTYLAKHNSQKTHNSGIQTLIQRATGQVVTNITISPNQSLITYFSKWHIWRRRGRPLARLLFGSSSMPLFWRFQTLPISLWTSSHSPSCS